MQVTLIKRKEGRLDRNTGTIINGKLKTCAYARVSSDSEDQKNSYESQLKYYKTKINANPLWEFVEVYADEAISGTLDYKRDNFMRMIQDALEGKIDLILTKSVSRFARNTVDSLKYIRKLKEKNIGVYFEEEGINTLEMSGELLITILSAVAQQESETISSHVLLGLNMKKERGEIIAFSKCLGYKYNYETRTMEINKEEAEIVKYIFNRYCEGMGATNIAKELTKSKYKTPRGSSKWCESTIRGILKNEKYKGDVLQGKTFTIDPISHKRLSNMGEEDKYYISKTEMQEKLIALLGGRAAEKLVLDDISTGASNDIEVATKIARDMVTKYGMSDTLGPIDFQGQEPYEIQMFGENIGDKIGLEVKRLIDTAYNDAQTLLKEHRDKLDLIANALLEKEKVNEEEFERIFKVNS